MNGKNWVCSFCGHHQTIVSDKFHSETKGIFVGKNCHENTAYNVTAIGCSNPDCGEIDIHFSFGERGENPFNGRTEIRGIIASRRIRPESMAKPQPDYIPVAIRTDYYESCRIKDLSAKASATLSRRCIQGMIRDFCGISKNRLVDEISELRKQVDERSAASGITAESVDAIDHVRSIGNFGAHMEKDINLIIDVEPGEAQALIELIELLLDEWYVARKTRQDHLDSEKQIATAKMSAKSEASNPDDEGIDIQEDKESIEAA